MSNFAEILEKNQNYSSKRYIRGKIVTQFDQIVQNFPNYRVGQLLESLKLTLEKEKNKKTIWNLTDEEFFSHLEKLYKKICKEEEEMASDFYDVFQD